MSYGLPLASVGSGVLIYNDTTVNNGITYYYVITALNSEGESVVSTEISVVPGQVPSPPQNLSATYSNQQVDLSWDVPTDDGGLTVFQYHIFNATSIGGPYTELGVSSTTSYTHTGLINGQTYFYKVTAENTKGQSDDSEIISVTPAIPPSAPTNLVGIAGNKTIDLTWDPIVNDGGSPLIGYNIYRDSVFLTSVVAGTTNYQDTGLTNGQSYTYTVRANNSEGESIDSNSASSTPVSTPGIPQNLVAGYGDSSVTLTWTAPADIGGSAIIVYTIYRDGSYLYNQTVGTSYTDNTVTNGVSYSYTVTAWNSEGESLESSATNVTPKTLPGIPTNLSASYGDSSVTLTWTAPADIGGSAIIAYTIYRDGVFLANQTIGTSYTDNTVTNGVSYSYTVTAWNSEGESLESTGANVTPKTTPGTPTGVSASYGDSFVTLTWNIPSDIGGAAIINYTIYRDGVFLANQTIGTSYTDNTVTNGVLYSYTITAWNSEGESIETNPVNVTPLIVASAPENLTVNYGNEQVELNWNPPADIGGSPILEYKIYRDDVLIATVTVGTSYTDSGLTNGQLYSYYVTAINSEGEGAASLVVSEIPRSISNMPTSLSAIYGDSWVTISWIAPIDDGGAAIIAYTIYRDGVYLANQTVGTSYTDNSVINGVQYAYTIAAWNSEGQSLESTVTSVTPAALPSIPTNFSAELYDLNNAYLSWDAPIDNGGYVVSQYRIYRSTDSSEFISLANVTNLNYNDSFLFIGVIYTYKVAAVTFEGVGEFTTEISVIPKTIPIVSSLVVIDSGNKFVSLAWYDGVNDGGSIITEYKIYRTTSPIGEYSDPIAIITASNQFYKDKTVENGLIYYYVITATNEVGESEFSPEVSATPSSVPDAPVNLVGIEELETAVLTWDAGFDGGSPIIEYNVYRNSTNDKTLSLISTTSELTETDTDLEKGITYEYVVTAVNINGESQFSNKISILIPLDTTSETSTSSSDSDIGSDINITTITVVIAGLLAAFGLGAIFIRRRR